MIKEYFETYNWPFLTMFSCKYDVVSVWRCANVVPGIALVPIARTKTYYVLEASRRLLVIFLFDGSLNVLPIFLKSVHQVGFPRPFC